MTEIKTYCDHCGKLLDGMSGYEETRIEVAYKWLDADLCCECFEKLWDTISEFCGAMKDENGDTDRPMVVAV